MRASLTVLVILGCLIGGLGTYDTVPKWGLLYCAAALSAVWLLTALWRFR